MQRDLKRAVSVFLAAKYVRQNFIDAGIGTPKDRDFCEAVDTVIEYIIDTLKIMGGVIDASDG